MTLNYVSIGTWYQISPIYLMRSMLTPCCLLSPAVRLHGPGRGGVAEVWPGHRPAPGRRWSPRQLLHRYHHPNIFTLHSHWPQKWTRNGSGCRCLQDACTGLQFHLGIKYLLYVIYITYLLTYLLCCATVTVFNLVIIKWYKPVCVCVLL